MLRKPGRWSLLLLASLVGVIITLACNGAAATPTATPTPGPALPSAQEIKQAGHDLFDAIAQASRDNDAAAFHRLMTSDLRERCTVEQLEGLVEAEDDLFTGMDIRAAYLDLEDSNRAWLEVARSGVAEGTMESFTFPIPMVREEGLWRTSYPFLPPGEGCPYAMRGEASEPTSESMSMSSRTSMTAPPGVQLLDSRSGRSSRGGTKVEEDESLFIRTDMTLAELLDYYRQQLLQPGEGVQHESVAEDLAVLTWNFRNGDDEGSPWIGVLMIVPAGENLRWVRVWKTNNAPSLWAP